MTDGAPRIFDDRARKRAQERARRLDGDIFLAREAADGLVHRLSAVNRKFSNGVAVATSDIVRKALDPFAPTWTAVEIGTQDALNLPEAQFDLAVSALALHAVNDLPGVLVQIRRALKPDGLFLAAVLGGATLQELRASLAAAEIETTGGMSPHVAPFADVRDLGGLLQRAGFALPVADAERTTVRYGEFASLLSDLRVHGETNALAERRQKPLSRATLAAAIAHYEDNFADPDGKLRATFDIVYLTGWAPHESQQKPLAPGSARMRLADALGTQERSAGETAGPQTRK
jgi:SAM-dependent methyltransferase